MPSIFDVTKALAQDYNQDQGMRYGPIMVNEPGWKVWTRGDGTRYRDPGSINATTGNDDHLPLFWEWLKHHPSAKYIGSLSHEFPSSGNTEAIQVRGIVFALRRNRIEYMSRGRVKNPNSVWKNKPTTESVAQIINKASDHLVRPRKQ